MKMPFGAVVVLLLAGVFAFATFGGTAQFKQDAAICQNFCALNNLEYAFIDEDQDCSCYMTQMYADVEQDAFIQWKTVVNTGKILNLSISKPMTGEQKKLIEQEIERRQLLQQQLQTQQGQ